MIKKERYEEEIEELSVLFFSFDKIDKGLSREREKVKLKLWIVLWNYYKSIYTDKKIELYSGVINETIANCFISYKIDSETPFLYYTNSAIKKEIERESQKDSYKGIKIPQKTEKNGRRLKKLAKQKGLTEDYQIVDLGKSLGLEIDDIQEAIDFNKTKSNLTISDNYKSDKCEEISIIDKVAYEKYTPENIFENRENCLNILEVIESTFLKKQHRVQKYLSALLTFYFFDDLISLENKEIELTYKFIDKVLFNELNSLSYNHSLPNQKDIAKRFGKDKTDASRTLRKFLNEIKSVNSLG
ncbi:MAG: hypothetical protein CR982_05440 [Candidatus Cloacimonadota bacterium]|nr:MAG: hypothetical protein CR982_05440 [Candidatus Cloacimonadota bacterium]PIE77589.1 MAG: hypothetical protein CSA15_12185 [Candidatus Delongbacteria bacterium]